MKQFKSSAEPIGFEGAQEITFLIDGDEVTAHPPTPGQIAMMMAAQARTRDTSDRIAGVIDFLHGVFDDRGRKMLETRLMDRENPLDFEVIEDVLMWLVEEWSARPTVSPSDSAPSPRSSGRKSTARAR